MIHCKNCNQDIDIKEVLLNSSFSWPNLQTVWYLCTECNTGNHVRLQNKEIQRIEIVGAPGPEWEIVERSKDENISFREDPGFLHIWYLGKHYEVEARK